MAKSKPMEKFIKTTKSFNYQKNEVSLNFALDVDNSAKLRDFKELLEAAVKDVTEQIEGMKN